MIFKVQGKYLEHFSWLQLSGFGILLFGIFLFNEIITLKKRDKDIQNNITDEEPEHFSIIEEEIYSIQ